jgi:hypothetical protein
MATDFAPNPPIVYGRVGRFGFADHSLTLKPGIAGRVSARA